MTQLRGDGDLDPGSRRGNGEQRPEFGHILKLWLMAFTTHGTWNMCEKKRGVKDDCILEPFERME